MGHVPLCEASITQRMRGRSQHGEDQDHEHAHHWSSDVPMCVCYESHEDKSKGALNLRSAEALVIFASSNNYFGKLSNNNRTIIQDTEEDSPRFPCPVAAQHLHVCTSHPRSPVSGLLPRLPSTRALLHRQPRPRPSRRSYSLTRGGTPVLFDTLKCLAS